MDKLARNSVVRSKKLVWKSVISGKNSLGKMLWCLCVSGQKLYYFSKESGLELDFLVRKNGECVVLEVKSKSGNTKSLATVMKNKSVYHINHAIKLGTYNVGRNGNLLTIPLYMGFLIQDSLADIVIPDIEW